MTSPELTAMLTKKSDIEERLIDLKARRKAIVSYYVIRLGWVGPFVGASFLFAYMSGNQLFAVFGVNLCVVSWSFSCFDSLDVLSELLDNIESMSRNKALLKKVENQIEDWVTR